MAAQTALSGIPVNRTPESSWFRRNLKWAAPVGCLSMVMVGCALVALWVVAISDIESSDIHRQAVARAHSSAAVVEALGTPVQEGSPVAGKIVEDELSGEAFLQVPLFGPKGKAILLGTAGKSGGQWSLLTLKLCVNSTGEEIDLLAEGGTP